jgi:hypothetical protein
MSSFGFENFLIRNWTVGIVIEMNIARAEKTELKISYLVIMSSFAVLCKILVN